MANNTNIWASGEKFDAKEFDRLIQRGVPWAQAIEQAGGGSHTGPLPTPAPYPAAPPPLAVRQNTELPPASDTGTPPMDDNEDEDSLPATYPGFSVKDAAGQYGNALSAYRSAGSDLASLYKQAEQDLRERRGSSWSSPENLLALSAAFFQPTRQRGFAGMMANVMPTLQGIASQREADQRKKEELLRTYGMETAKSRLGMAETEAKMAERQYAAALKNEQPKPMGVWSESLQRFVPKDAPAVIQSGTTPDGKRTEKMSDGSIRVYQPDGSVKVYDAGGNLVQ